MIFNFSAIALTAVSVISLASARSDRVQGSLGSLAKRAGPSGGVVIPAGEVNDGNTSQDNFITYNSGDALHLQYKIANVPGYAVTSSIAVTLKSRADVAHTNYTYPLASAVAYPSGTDTIDVYLRVPYINPRAFPGNAAIKGSLDGQVFPVELQVIETQTGSLGAAPFIAAAPRLHVRNVKKA